MKKIVLDGDSLNLDEFINIVGLIINFTYGFANCRN